jgi:uncharacterized protein YndB with AHSA1/START domain
VFEFDPDRVARLEADGWRAYYDRQWGNLLSLMATLNHEQFHIPMPLAYVGAYHIARASVAWVPIEHDLATVHAHLVHFYRIARRYSGLRFEPSRAAARELDYWVVHRQLIDASDKSAFVAALAALHAELFDAAVDRMRESAEWRVAANTTVDRITSGASTNPESDWLLIEDQLTRCYRSIYRVVNGREAPQVDVVPDYRFVTSWRFAAPVERVWEILRKPEGWPGWWYGLESVTVLLPGDEQGVGAVRRFVFRGQLPYRLSFSMRQTRQERPTLLEGRAWGELEGIGRWELRPVGSGTDVRYTWEVSPTAAWMKLLAPLARPAFVWNHDWVMRQGERGLKQLLEAPAPVAPDALPHADPSRSATGG